MSDIEDWVDELDNTAYTLTRGGATSQISHELRTSVAKRLPTDETVYCETIEEEGR